jgi:hypothetical protein
MRTLTFFFETFALACGDVVKKPKLDQHRGRCHAGFDCIDCHTTFNSPAEYKDHTSCISEAEKYQKGLYKGPKSVGLRSTTARLYHSALTVLCGTEWHRTSE